MPKDPANTEESRARRRGRPVQMDPAERESLVLEAAIGLMSDTRPDEVTMAAIAQRASMSKRTLYALYGSREELLGACLQQMGKSLFRPLRPDERDASLEDRLRILLTLNPSMENPQAPLEMLRAVIAEARSYPQLACSLGKNGPGQVVDLLCRELTAAAAAGDIALSTEDIPGAAELLLDMVMGNTIACLLDPDRMLRLPAERAARRDRAIAIFLNGVRPRGD